jgi:phosphoribosylaminoimidazole-succinocarboxamide synthase
MTFKHQTNFYRGKVRDVYTIDDHYLVMIATDRISAFDVILPHTIPYKGQVLNQIAAKALQETADIVPNWLKSVPLPHVSVGLKCDPFPVEMVIRGNLTGHAWRTYQSGARTLCGVNLPEGLHENDPFPTPIITPTTKAKEGHDLDISKDEILQQGLIGKEDYEQLERYTFKLFERGKQIARERGLILVDTKYEFGKSGTMIYLIDEIHTPDSSRFFYAEGFEERQKSGQAQKQLSKEFLREWLISHNFMGKEGQTIPEMSKEFIQEVSDRYIELFEQITGEPFQKHTIIEDQIPALIDQVIRNF